MLTDVGETFERRCCINNNRDALCTVLISNSALFTEYDALLCSKPAFNAQEERLRVKWLVFRKLFLRNTEKPQKSVFLSHIGRFCSPIPYLLPS
jgi:hypothetical protein